MIPRVIKRHAMAVEYSLDLVEAVCLRLAAGESMLAISRDEGMPSSRAWYGWILKYPEAMHNYTRAREVQGHVRADMATEAAINAKDPQLGRLAYDALRWHASKLVPKIYGDKQLHTGPDGESPVGFVLYGERESKDGQTWQAQHSPSPK